MRKILFSGIVMIILLISLPGIGRDFAPGDFDPADPSQVDTYRQAVVDLVEEMTIVGKDETGNELFSAVPFPLELVAMMTQLQIHESNITDPVEIDMLLADQNSLKPAPNSFAFVLDGDPAMVTGDVRMAYTTDASQEPVYLDLFNVDTETPDESSAVTTWAVAIADVEQLDEFMNAEKVSIFVSNADEGRAPIELNCGFWRLWGLFDMRVEPGEAEFPQASESPAPAEQNNGN
ncbi:MAG: hypothetical protein NTY09_10075 [bacterium]|nr:hypothetical protein [bacterium]